jgi:hypothetical protein
MSFGIVVNAESLLTKSPATEKTAIALHLPAKLRVIEAPFDIPLLIGWMMMSTTLTIGTKRWLKHGNYLLR